MKTSTGGTALVLQALRRRRTRRPRPIRYLALVALAAIAVTACSDDAPQVIDIVGNGTGYEGLPAELEAGVYEMTFSNSADAADGPLFIASGDSSPEEFMAAFAPVLEGGPFPDFLNEAVGFPTTQPGTSSKVTMTLPPGNYMFFSFFDSDADPVFAQVAVTGKDLDYDDLPKTDAVIQGRDYGFDVSGIKAGTQSVTFRNAGPTQFHHGVMMRFPDGTSIADAEAAMATLFELPEDAAPPEGVPFPEDVFDTGVFSPGTGGTFEASFEAGGTYVVLCFIGDRGGGPPHAIAYGMMEAFTVES